MPKPKPKAKPAKKPKKKSSIARELAAIPVEEPQASPEAPQAATPIARPAAPKIRNRIKRHVTMRAGDLVPHEMNFRRHPEGQRKALQGMYDEIGFARSLLAYELPDGRLKLVDGHLRQEMEPEMQVTVEVLDLTEAEAKLMLAATDPLSAMATADPAALSALLLEVDVECAELKEMLDDLAALPPGEGTPGEPKKVTHVCPNCGCSFAGGQLIAGEAK
jgi:hypothetical protein